MTTVLHFTSKKKKNFPDSFKITKLYKVKIMALLIFFFFFSDQLVNNSPSKVFGTGQFCYFIRYSSGYLS